MSLRPEAIEILRKHDGLDGLTAHERTLAEVVQTLLRTHEMPEDLYQRAFDELGPRQLVETVGLIGNYCTIGMTINTFQVNEESPTF